MLCSAPELRDLLCFRGSRLRYPELGSHGLERNCVFFTYCEKYQEKLREESLLGVS